jgi:hypothetical protein
MSKLSQNPAPFAATSRQTARQSRTSGAGLLFGVPVGDLGWFATLLLSLASGFATFFAGTFFAIMAILIYNTAGHHTVDFAISYRRIGLPLGLAVAVLALSYLGSLWIRRQLRRA